MQSTTIQNLILIEGAATYERILSEVREVELDEGIRHISDFLKIFPDFARAHNDLAVMYYQAGNSLKALAHYEKAHKLDSGNITYRKNLADFYFVELEWTSDAIHTYLDILKDNPFDIEALNSLGSISLQIGRREQARQYYSRTLQLDSENQDALLALKQLPPPSNSQTDIKQVARQPAPLKLEQPASARAATQFKDLFRAAEQCTAPVTAAADPIPPVQTLTQTSEQAPVSTDLYKEAQLLANSGQLDRAILLLEQLLAENNTNATAHNDLGVFYQKKGVLDKSRFHHEEAARLQPANKIFQKNLADLLYIEFYEFEKALGLYVRLQAKSPQDIEVLKAIASICQTVGKDSDARYFLERVLTLQPWDRDAQESLKAMEESDRARA